MTDQRAPDLDPSPDRYTLPSRPAIGIPAAIPPVKARKIDHKKTRSVKAYLEYLRARHEATEALNAELRGPRVDVDDLRARLVDADGLRAIPPPDPLVCGYLFRNSLAWLGGKPGHGKTFVAIDLACCVGAGVPWHEHETRQGRVLYVIAEGAGGLSQRVDAWAKHRGLPAAGVTFLPVPVHLVDDNEAVCALVATGAYALVIIDTQAKTSAGLDENSSRDMGVLVAALDRIRQASGACVLPLHHEPRSGENLRGSTALEGAADTILRVSKDGPWLTVESTKQKDIEAAGPYKLALREHGPSMILTRDLGTAATLMTESELKIIETLRQLGGEAASTRLIDASGLARSTVYRSVSGLYERGQLRMIKDGRSIRYALPERRDVSTEVSAERPIGS